MHLPCGGTVVTVVLVGSVCFAARGLAQRLPAPPPDTLQFTTRVGTRLLDQAIADQRQIIHALDDYGPPVTPLTYMTAAGIEQATRRDTHQATPDGQLARYLRWQTAAMLHIVTQTQPPTIPPLFAEQMSVTGQLARARCAVSRDMRSCARQLAEVILARLTAMR